MFGEREAFMGLKQEGKPKNEIVHIIVIVIMLFVGIFFTRNTVMAYQKYRTEKNANFVQVYATITSYEQYHNRHNTGYTYSTFYEYKSNGGVYYGMWQRLIKDENVAKEQVGKKVPIYVDEELKIHVKSLDDIGTSGVWLAGVLSVISWLIFTNSFVREIIFIVHWIKYKKEG